MGARWGYVDRTGAWVIAPRFAAAAPFEKGRARVREAGGDAELWIDPAGATLGEAEAPSGSERWTPEGGPWDEIAGTAEGVALVRTGAEWRFVDRGGKPVGRGVFEAAGLPGEGLAPVRRDGEWGFYDIKAARQAIQPQFEAAQGFRDGRAGVRMGGAWAYVDRTGSPMTDAVWEAVGGFSDKLGAVRQGGLWGFVDTRGHVVIAPRFEVVGPFREGLAAAGVVERAPVAFGPTRGVRLRPRLGLQHHLFEGMGPEDRLQVWLGFDLLAAGALAALRSTVATWAEGVGAAVIEQSVGESSAWLDVSGLSALRQDVSTLIEAVREAGLPLREAAFTRLREVDGAWRAVSDPFGAEDVADPPATAWLDDGSSAVEVAGALPAFPDVKIARGLVPSKTVASDARTAAVCAALDQVLSDWLADAWHLPGWPAVRPAVLSSRGEPGAIDRITAEGRFGYLFGVHPGDVEQLLAPGRVRWRDAELLEAVVAVVRGLGLDRAISWERRTEPAIDGRPTPTAFVFQLWEPAQPVR